MKIAERSGVAEARRRARRHAIALGFSSTKVEHVAIAATEAAHNLLRHAGGGDMLVQAFGPPGGERLALIALDDGPGIARLDRMLKDGASSMQSSGTGFGAMKRLSDKFDVFTAPGGGTVVTLEFRPDAAAGLRGVDVAALRQAYPGERVCGDSVALRGFPGFTLAFVCDGLGHGRRAAEAANHAYDAFLGSSNSNPAELLLEISAAMEGTRGGVGAVARIDTDAMTLTHAGVGNITTMHMTQDKVKRLPVRDGYLGSSGRSPQTETVPLSSEDIILMHSDGVSTLRGLERRAPLMQRGALAIAARLMHDNLRGRDDASIIALRLQPALAL
nr:SpoIIE family protein phosphatase [Pacificimonas flava]